MSISLMVPMVNTRGARTASDRTSAPGGGAVPKREKSKRLQVVISEEQDSLLTKTAYQLSNPERLVSKSEVVRLGIALLHKAVAEGTLDGDLLDRIDEH
jgi:hypothetical protein